MKFHSFIGAAVIAAGAAFSANAATIQEASTYTPINGETPHSVYLNGDKYDFAPNGSFIVDGTTATLTGSATGSAGTIGVSFSFDQNLSFTPQPKFPNSFSPAPNTALWTFWNLLGDEASDAVGESTITKNGNVYDVISKPIGGDMTFQSGFGANDKNPNELGMSGWFFLQGRNGAGNLGCGNNSVCDLNIALSTPRDFNIPPVPVPASALLLIGAVAGLGGLRKFGARKAA